MMEVFFIFSFFLAPVDHTCFCVTCLKHRGDELYKKKGDPPKDYAVPQGWVRFALRANHKPNWHVAYHGLKAAHLRRVLDRGQLLPKGRNWFEVLIVVNCCN